MINKVMEWFLGKAYRYHKTQSMRCLNKANELFQAGRYDEDLRYYAKYDYHVKRCARIDTLLYAMEGS